MQWTQRKLGRLEAALKEGLTIHERDSTEDYSGQINLKISKSLHRLLAEYSQKEGINMEQYRLYPLSKNGTLYMKPTGIHCM